MKSTITTIVLTVAFLVIPSRTTANTLPVVHAPTTTVSAQDRVWADFFGLKHRTHLRHEHTVLPLLLWRHLQRQGDHSVLPEKGSSQR